MPVESVDTQAASPLRIFISYGHDEHEDLARRLREDLQSRGHQVWFDRAELRPGVDWESHIDSGLEWLAEDRDHARMLLLLTPHAVRRPDGFCLNEIARAVSRRIGIIPVMVALCEPPLSICRIQYLDMRDCLPLDDNDKLYSRSLESLLAALEGKGTEIEGFGSRKLHALEPIDFAAELAAHPPDFTGRAWLFDELQTWLTEPEAPRVFVLIGAPGVGKTALAVELIHRSQHVAAFHICIHTSKQKSDPLRLVTSLAYQLSTQLPEYEEALKTLDLEYVVDTYDASTLFDVLLTQPLARVSPPEAPMVIVIDGLDEATQNGTNAVAEFLSERAQHLPRWVRIVVTSRPEPEVLRPLKALGVHTIEPLAAENLSDIRQYALARLGKVSASAAAKEHAVNVITERCEGVMLYARHACDHLEREGISPGTLETLPQGLFALYARQLTLRCPRHESFAEGPRPLLSLLLAAREPLDTDLVCAALGRTRSETWDVVVALGSLVVDDGKTLALPHKTLRDWLSDRTASQQYHVGDDEGHTLLAAVTGDPRSIARSARGYLYLHGPQHLLHTRQWDDLLSVLSNPAFQAGRRALFDSVLREPRYLDLLLDLVDEIVASGSTELLSALLDRLEAGIASGHWEATEAVVEVARQGLEPAQAERLLFLRAWTLQQRGLLSESLALYDEFDDAALDGGDGLVAFRRADVLRESGRFDEAFDVYAQLVRREELPLNLTILYAQQYADLLFVRGQYVDALGVLDSVIAGPSGDAQDVFAEALRIRGHVHRVLLDHEAALADYLAALSIFTGIGHRMGIARIETNLAETYATADPECALWHARHAFALNEGIDMPLEAGKAVRAEGLALVLLRRDEEAVATLGTAVGMLSKVGYIQGVCESWAHEVILRSLRDEYETGASLTHRLTGRLRQLNAYPLLVVRSCMALELRHPLGEDLVGLDLESSSTIQWAVARSTYRERLASLLGPAA